MDLDPKPITRYKVRIKYDVYTKNHDFGSFSIQFRHGVFWNGGIHWINPYDGNSSRFDIEQETLQAMPRPPLPEDWNSNNFRHFMESQGHMFFIDFNSSDYIIYQMEKDCSNGS